MTNQAHRARCVRFFRIAFYCGNDEYGIIPFPLSTGRTGKAFRLRKQTGDRRCYTVVLTPHGQRCDCKGFRRWHHCKHVEMLQAARMLD